MSLDITYLELSEGDQGSHKFYEVIVEGAEVRIRYGRIGDKGQQQNKTYPTAEKAQAEATKKINEKKRKGYAPAVMGERQKRSVVTRRSVVSVASTATRAPVLWSFRSDSTAFGIFIDGDRCWLGNQRGQVFNLDHQGQINNQFQLPEGVKCIVADDIWIYVGCDDGNVYDLSGKLPRLAYEIDPNIDIYWLDIYDGTLAVSDANGAIVKIEPTGEQWTRLSQGQAGWMVRCDGTNLYHGHYEGVTAYDLDAGRQLWQQTTNGAVLFGWLEGEGVYAGTSAKKLYRLSKQGEVEQIYACDASVYSCAASKGGKYVFAGDSSSSIYCFEASGKRLWKLGTGCGSALSMQFLGDRLYLVTTDGVLACVDASSEAIASAQTGELPQTRQIEAKASSSAASVNTPMETTSSASSITSGQGVIVECFRQGSELRVRAVSEGYNSEWFVQFPRDIREEGAKYWVQELRESARGGFYRAYGDIKRYV